MPADGGRRQTRLSRNVLALDQVDSALGPVPDAIRCRVLRMHSRLHIEIMTRRRSRWSTCRPLLAHRAESAHQRHATTGITLIEAVDGALGRVTADAAYDTIGFYEAAGARGATVWFRRRVRPTCLDTDRGRALVIARSWRSRREDGDAGRRRRAIMGRPAWRTRSSDTSRSSETAFERAVRQGGELRSSSRATS